MPKRVVRKVSKDFEKRLAKIRNVEDKVAILEQIATEGKSQVAVQLSERVPGQIVGIAKTAFTLADWEKVSGIAEFSPEETVMITLNGISRQFLAGVTGLYPKAFIDVYHARKRILMDSEKNIKKDVGFDMEVHLGAGAFD